MSLQMSNFQWFRLSGMARVVVAAATLFGVSLLLFLFAPKFQYSVVLLCWLALFKVNVSQEKFKLTFLGASNSRRCVQRISSLAVCPAILIALFLIANQYLEVDSHKYLCALAAFFVCPFVTFAYFFRKKYGVIEREIKESLRNSAPRQLKYIVLFSLISAIAEQALLAKRVAQRRIPPPLRRLVDINLTRRLLPTPAPAMGAAV